MTMSRLPKLSRAKSVLERVLQLYGIVLLLFVQGLDQPWFAVAMAEAALRYQNLDVHVQVAHAVLLALQEALRLS